MRLAGHIPLHRPLRLFCSCSGMTVIIMAQFGKSGDKTATYQAVFSALEQSLANGGQLRGALFWRWNEDGGSDLNTVYTNDSTWRYAPQALEPPSSSPCNLVSWASRTLEVQHIALSLLALLYSVQRADQV